MPELPSDVDHVTTLVQQQRRERVPQLVRPTRRDTGGLVLGFLSVVLIIAPWRDVSGTATGALACLAAAASYAVSYVYMRRYLTGRGASPIARRQPG